MHLFSENNFFNPVRILVRFLNRLFRAFGVELGRYSNGVSLEAALDRITKKKNLDISTVIDVGSSDGRWSYKALDYFPNANYLLIDGNEIHKPKLDYFTSRFPQTDYVIAAAGKEIGTIWFDNSVPLGGLASENPIDDNYVEVPVTTIDTEIEKRGWEGPYLIKLDTHGFEIPIFEGATAALQQADLLIVETYNFQVAPESLHFTEMIAYLDQLGFYVIDMCEPLFRPTDGAFWQIDLFFARKERVEFSDHQYD